MHLVWCPSHRGNSPNDKADRLAKNGPFSRNLHEISPEDIRQRECIACTEEVEYEWINSDYAISYTHLRPECNYSRWVSARSLDVTLARW